jgi:xylitol oxidase
MDKRTFLKKSGALAAGGILSRLAAGSEKPAEVRRNWAGNQEFTAPNLFLPHSVEEVQSTVKRCATVKALGTKHSFNRIADSPQNQISLKNLTGMALNRDARTVTEDAGVSYGVLAPYLDKNGFALHNLASLPHISVAGARSTATHGSGVKNGNLSTAVAALEMVTADGEIVHLSREHDSDRFNGAVVDLGGLGVVTKVTLDVQPTFTMRQVVYENLPMEELEHHLYDILSSGYSVSLFTDWQKHRITQVWIKSRVDPGKPFSAAPEFYGATLATRNLHPLAGHSAENCTAQMGVPGPWYERMPHFRMNFTPSSGDELQTEYFVPLERGYEALLAVEKLRDQVSPHLMITEVRTIAEDRLWMSPCYKRPSMAIHFTWKPEWPEVRKVLPLIEKQLEPFAARPHWAKLFTMEPAQLQSRYEKLADYRALLKHYDPHGKFRNPFLDTNIYS